MMDIKDDDTFGKCHIELYWHLYLFRFDFVATVLQSMTLDSWSKFSSCSSFVFLLVLQHPLLIFVYNLSLWMSIFCGMCNSGEIARHLLSRRSCVWFLAPSVCTLFYVRNTPFLACFLVRYCSILFACIKVTCIHAQVLSVLKCHNTKVVFVRMRDKGTCTSPR